MTGPAWRGEPWPRPPRRRAVAFADAWWAVPVQGSSEAALAAGPADRVCGSSKPCGSTPPAPRHVTQEPVRGLRAAVRRPVDRQAVPLRTRRRYCRPPRPASLRHGNERRISTSIKIVAAPEVNQTPDDGYVRASFSYVLVLLSLPEAHLVMDVICGSFPPGWGVPRRWAVCPRVRSGTACR